MQLFVHLYVLGGASDVGSACRCWMHLVKSFGVFVRNPFHLEEAVLTNISIYGGLGEDGGPLIHQGQPAHHK